LKQTFAKSEIPCVEVIDEKHAILLDSIARGIRSAEMADRELKRSLV